MSTLIHTKRKAVSPVIATVILIAVAVALGIAVAFWASGLTSSFSKYEKLGVNTQYATGSSSTGWRVYLGGQNTGSSDATITQIQVNGVPVTNSSLTTPPGSYAILVNSSSGVSSSSSSTLSISVRSGATFSLTLTIPSSCVAGTCSPIPGKTFNDGQTIQVTIITAAGNNYPASIVLP
ncbi:MAG: archaellin/type IV pilin N-terminal domain-containing protein [Conexivisphaerales archaeon]